MLQNYEHLEVGCPSVVRTCASLDVVHPCKPGAGGAPPPLSAALVYCFCFKQFQSVSFKGTHGIPKFIMENNSWELGSQVERSGLRCVVWGNGAATMAADKVRVQYGAQKRASLRVGSRPAQREQRVPDRWGWRQCARM